MDYLFAKWAGLKERLKDRNLFLLLDYDGTLTPIAETPENAAITPAVKNLLAKLSESKKCKVAIISGRALEDIKNKVGLENIIYAGEHGLEITGPKIKFKVLIPPNYKATLRRIRAELTQNLSSIKGVILEYKSLSLSIHFRLANKREIPRVKSLVRKATAGHVERNEVAVKPGKMVLEIGPPGKRGKGEIIRCLLDKQKSAFKGKKLAYVYIGDDVTDEDAFKTLQKRGVTVFVGKPKKFSYAKFYLKDAGEVFEFLKRISYLT